MVAGGVRVVGTLDKVYAAGIDQRANVSSGGLKIIAQNCGFMRCCGSHFHSRKAWIGWGGRGRFASTTSPAS